MSEFKMRAAAGGYGAILLVIGVVLVTLDCAMNAGTSQAGLHLPAYVNALRAWEATSNDSTLFGFADQWRWTLDSIPKTGNFSICSECTGEYDPTCVFVPSSRRPKFTQALTVSLPPPTADFTLVVQNVSTVLLSETFSLSGSNTDAVTCEALQEIVSFSTRLK